MTEKGGLNMYGGRAIANATVGGVACWPARAISDLQKNTGADELASPRMPDALLGRLEDELAVGADEDEGACRARRGCNAGAQANFAASASLGATATQQHVIDQALVIRPASMSSELLYAPSFRTVLHESSRESRPATNELSDTPELDVLGTAWGPLANPIRLDKCSSRVTRAPGLRSRGIVRKRTLEGGSTQSPNFWRYIGIGGDAST
ncbi:uncharacterized protein LAESUDRAFT_710366 [Laetiporus sulphureus 93-53]|uniref:Uncharacterized protein n=1 Tax=Laetiporus sulphureus 93-53 TaxID=1314785 RepID=A0A165HJ90_9APHY|nr:uncharacterized protein LAESUDRAFT_710366 [Laetiporus sulphureus 93-53]KZT11798.1 hypothetical protein LAESUDRAFT_710366 [Laetiporus sulphureus 93-53]